MVNFLWILLYAPYIVLAQSRAELVSVCGRLSVYTTAFLPTIPDSPVTSSQIENALINIQFIMVLHNIYTQLYPLLGSFLDPFLDPILKILKPYLNIWGKICVIFHMLEKSDEFDVDEKLALPGGYHLDDQVSSLIESDGPHIPLVKYDQMIFNYCNPACIYRLLLNCFFPIQKDDGIVREGSEGIVVGEVSEEDYPDDYNERVLVEFKSQRLILALLVKIEIKNHTQEFRQSIENKQLLSNVSNLPQNNNKHLTPSAETLLQQASSVTNKDQVVVCIDEDDDGDGNGDSVTMINSIDYQTTLEEPDKNSSLSEAKSSTTVMMENFEESVDSKNVSQQEMSRAAEEEDKKEENEDGEGLRLPSFSTDFMSSSYYNMMNLSTDFSSNATNLMSRSASIFEIPWNNDDSKQPAETTTSTINELSLQEKGETNLRKEKSFRVPIGSFI